MSDEYYDKYQINEIQLAAGKHVGRTIAHFDVVAKRRRQINGSSLWVVAQFGNVLNHDLEWELEGWPSEPCSEDQARTHWPTLDEAIAAFTRYQEVMGAIAVVRDACGLGPDVEDDEVFQLAGMSSFLGRNNPEWDAGLQRALTLLTEVGLLKADARTQRDTHGT